MTGEPPPVLPAGCAWAQGVIAAAGDTQLPVYGSPEWDALPYDSPARLAAALVAAEVWRYEQATLETRLRVELDAGAAENRRAWLEEEEAGYRAIAQGLPRSVFVPPPAPFADARPVVQTDDWPPVATPGGRRPRIPSTVAMIRRPA